MRTISGRKIEHLTQQISHKLSTILQKEANDPRFSRVTITGVKLASDLSTATVYYAIFADNEKISDLTDSLNKAAGFFGQALARTMTTRKSPRLTFRFDNGFDEGAKMDKILAGLDIHPAED